MNSLDKMKCKFRFTHNDLWFLLHDDCKSKMNTKVFRHSSIIQIYQTVFLSFPLDLCFVKVLQRTDNNNNNKNTHTSELIRTRELGSALALTLQYASVCSSVIVSSLAMYFWLYLIQKTLCSAVLEAMISLSIRFHFPIFSFISAVSVYLLVFSHDTSKFYSFFFKKNF